MAPQITGSNSTALVQRKRRTFTDDPHGDEARGRSEKREPVKRKKRTTFWGDDDGKPMFQGLPTVLPSGLTPDQLNNYVITMRLEELGRKLRTNDVFPPEEERSPSPEPIYGPGGIRINTRDARYRKKFEDERHKLVDAATRDIPGFKPPADYKRPNKLTDKVYIPYKDFPDVNFIGLLIGPRGHTLKKMEAESGAKVSIRGKGSLKEGKVGQAQAGDDDELHCLVMAETEDRLKSCMKMIQLIIETATTIPESQNELKRMQLRELASLNGTLRDDDQIICSNCGESGHRKYECHEMSNITVNLVCKICNGVGHTAGDCLMKNNPEVVAEAQAREQQLDSEYASFMADLGVKPQQDAPQTGQYGDWQQYAQYPQGHYGPPPGAPMMAPPPSAYGWTAPPAQGYYGQPWMGAPPANDYAPPPPPPDAVPPPPDTDVPPPPPPM